MAVPNYEKAVKRIVKRSKQNVLLLESLPTKALKILEVLGAGGTAKAAALQSKCTKQNVSYWVKKLINMGLLKLQTKDVLCFYSLTLLGQKFFATSGNDEVVVLEDFAVKFFVVEGEKVCLDWVKLGEPRNWVKLGVRVDGVRVVRTSKSLIVHPGKMFGFDVDSLEVEAGQVVERVRGVLEGKFGMVLSAVGEPLHKPVYRIYSKEAASDVKNGTCIVDGVGSVDNSPPERIPHEEYVGKDRVKARLLLPDAVRTLTDKVDGLQVQVSALTDSMVKFTDMFSKLLNQSTDVSGAGGVPPLKRDYSV